MIDRKPLGYSWLQGIHRDLKPNATFDVFVNSLRLNSYGDDYISVSDFEEWVQSLGEKLNISSKVGAEVKNAIIVQYSSNKNMLPTRKTIDSCFLNLAGAAWSYYDAIKVTAMSVASSGKMIADATGKLVYAATSVGGSLLGIFTSKLVLYPVVGFVGWLIWKNRETLGLAMTNKIVKKIANPHKKYKTRSKRK